MMTTLERKNIIKKKIDFSDEVTLEKIEKLLEEDVYKLSKDQEMRVKEAKAQYEKGKSISDEQHQKDLEEWFEKQEKLFGL